MWLWSRGEPLIAVRPLQNGQSALPQPRRACVADRGGRSLGSYCIHTYTYIHIYLQTYIRLLYPLLTLTLTLTLTYMLTLFIYPCTPLISARLINQHRQPSHQVFLGCSPPLARYFGIQVLFEDRPFALLHTRICMKTSHACAYTFLRTQI